MYLGVVESGPEQLPTCAIGKGRGPTNKKYEHSIIRIFSYPSTSYSPFNKGGIVLERDYVCDIIHLFKRHLPLATRNGKHCEIFPTYHILARQLSRLFDSIRRKNGWSSATYPMSVKCDPCMSLLAQIPDDASPRDAAVRFPGRRPFLDFQLM